MIFKGLHGTWKGESIVPGKLRALGTDKVTDFYLRLKQFSGSNTFSGILIGNPENSEMNEHAELAGELLDNSEISFETRYSKFYFYSDHDESELVTLDQNIITKVRYMGKIVKKDMIIGTWESEPTMFEYQGIVRKTLPWQGEWWAKKMP